MSNPKITVIADAVYTIDEAAEIEGVSTRTIKRRIEAGDLRTFYPSPKRERIWGSELLRSKPEAA